MSKPLTREEYIRKGKQLQRLSILPRFLQGFRRFLQVFRKKEKAQREEIFIDTEFGKARTLWYGFENSAAAPVFFDLHGGGFVLGDADADEAINLEFNKQVGCKVISIEYAKAPDFPYPTAVNQIYAVVKHVFENAEKYAIEPQKMAIGGHSAGGNLSAVTCMKAKEEGLFQFACQVLDYPPLDLATSALEKPQPTGCIPPEMALMFDACYVDPSQARDPHVSPVYADPEDLKGLPPALFILAGSDSLHDEGLRYREMLADAGVETECYDYPNALHGFTMQPSVDTTDACAKMAAFLEKYLQ
jgi:acetyl esterase